LQPKWIPAQSRRLERAAQLDTFEAITREWLHVWARRTDERTRATRLTRFEMRVFP